LAESSLSLAFTELQQRVGFFLGYGSVVADWSAAQDAEIILNVQSGVRRVYYPMGVSADLLGYEWSWLRPTETLYLGASGTDGSIVTATFDSATYTDWVDQGITTADTVDITAIGSGSTTIGDYAIQSVATGAITLTSSPGDGTSLTFWVKRTPANYNLPDNFGRLIGDLHFAADDVRAPITLVRTGAILDMRARSDEKGTPYFAAVRPKSSTGSTGQRQEIIFYPEPDQAYTLSYNYEAYSGELTDALPYPLGGMQLSELYVESCLAAAEQRVNNEAGLHTQVYQAMLLDAVARDRKKGAHFYGHMGGRERDFGRDYRSWRRGRELSGGAYSITYDGSQL